VSMALGLGHAFCSVAMVAFLGIAVVDSWF
jgi:hypothetical protein